MRLCVAIPCFFGKMPFTDALREVGFAGVFSIEANLRVHENTEEGHAAAAREMAELARRLAAAASAQ